LIRKIANVSLYFVNLRIYYSNEYDALLNKNVEIYLRKIQLFPNERQFDRSSRLSSETGEIIGHASLATKRSDILQADCNLRRALPDVI